MRCCAISCGNVRPLPTIGFPFGFDSVRGLAYGSGFDAGSRKPSVTVFDENAAAKKFAQENCGENRIPSDDRQKNNDGNHDKPRQVVPFRPFRPATGTENPKNA